MSGGSWDYAYIRINDIAERLIVEKRADRRAFGRHMLKISKALHDIEWTDSGDFGPDGDVESIREVLGKDNNALMLKELYVQAKEIRDEINKLLPS